MGILRLYLALRVVAAHSTAVLPWSTHVPSENSATVPWHDFQDDSSKT